MCISILAVLADRDVKQFRRVTTGNHHFNPRGPCGPRPGEYWYLSLLSAYFNPRGPCGPRPSADLTAEELEQLFQSSRSLRTATAGAGRRWSRSGYFNPRGPCGPRLGAAILAAVALIFQSSRSLRTATASRSLGIGKGIFQSSRSLRTATGKTLSAVQYCRFQSSRSLRTATCRKLDNVDNIGISILAVLADRDGTML